MPVLFLIFSLNTSSLAFIWCPLLTISPTYFLWCCFEEWILRLEAHIVFPIWAHLPFQNFTVSQTKTHTHTLFIWRLSFSSPVLLTRTNKRALQQVSFGTVPNIIYFYIPENWGSNNTWKINCDGPCCLTVYIRIWIRILIGLSLQNKVCFPATVSIHALMVWQTQRCLDNAFIFYSHGTVWGKARDLG